MSYVHMGEWHWSINTTVPLDSLEIVDKLGSVSSPTYTTGKLPYANL